MTALPAKLTPMTKVPGSLDTSHEAGFSNSSSSEGLTVNRTIANDRIKVENESGLLLRERLRLTAGVIALLFAVQLIWGYFSGEAAQVILFSRLLRTLLATAFCILLKTQRHLSLQWLRAIELTLYAGSTLLLLFSQYVSNIEFIRRDDIAKVVTTELSGILNFTILIVMYGALIPNNPGRAIRMIFLMASGPFLVFGLLLEHPMRAMKHLDGINPSVLVGTHVIYLGIGSFVAITSSYILHGLRKELIEARRLGPYKLGACLGHGGMGEVYLAEHDLLKRPCALKLIKPELSANAIAVAMFEREVQAAASLRHPNTIEIFDYGRTPDGIFYYVMEFLPGLSSQQIVQQDGPLPPERAIYLMHQVCGALAEAHDSGILHSDMTPSNIFVAVLGGECDIAKVFDFGIARLIQPESREIQSDFMVNGTPAYMSPEQVSATSIIDGRTDLYSIGAILYFWLTGRTPFVETTSMAMMVAHTCSPVTPPSQLNPSIAMDLEAVILKALAKDPEERFGNARELAQALKDCQCSTLWDTKRATGWWAGKPLRFTS